MKRLIRALWRLTLPLRRPLQAKAERFVAGCVVRALEAHDPTKALADEVNLVLDALLAEHFRLQARVDELARLVQEGQEAAGAAR